MSELHSRTSQISQKHDYMTEERFPSLWPVDVVIMQWARGQRKELTRKRKTQANGGVPPPRQKRDPETAARAVANRKKRAAVAASTEDENSEPDGEQRSGSEEQAPAGSKRKRSGEGDVVPTGQNTDSELALIPKWKGYSPSSS